jgi:hypothetical protein
VHDAALRRRFLAAVRTRRRHSLSHSFFRLDLAAATVTDPDCGSTLGLAACVYAAAGKICV